MTAPRSHRIRLVWVLNHPSPHMTDLLRATARQPGVGVGAFFFAGRISGRDWDARPGGIPHQILAMDPPSDKREYLRRTGRLIAMIARENHRRTVFVLGGCLEPFAAAAAAYLAASGRRWLMCTEAPGVHYQARRLRTSVRDLWLRTMARRAGRSLAISRLAEGHFRRLGVPAGKVVPYGYYMDVSAFRQIEPTPRRRRVRFLFCGSMDHRKGVDTLLTAYRLVQAECDNTSLVVVGAGPLLSFARRWIRREGITGVQCRGSLSWQRRIEAFRGSSVLVLPTRFDGWGMVVPEAMAAGMPVISTARCGAAVSLVTPGRSGFLVSDPQDAGGLAEAMCYFARRPAEVRRMGDAARRAVASWTPEAGARIVCRAAEKVL